MNLPTFPPHELNRHFGAVQVDDNRCRFRIWAPAHEQLYVQIPERNLQLALTQEAGGFHSGEFDGVRAGDRYFIGDGGGTWRPDPASRFQPVGVHQASEVIAREFPWSDRDWKGIGLREWVIYELHIGTFTEGGTFDAAIKRLDELVDLGVTAIELMPVAASAGRWNWGYDGVSLFAPTENFGTPHAMKSLVDAAHAKGLAVVLDVVYNHLGPEGNYLGHWGDYFSDKHATPWGDAPNLDGASNERAVRDFFIANAIHWFDEYHLDALRVDAIHCMCDDSPTHVAYEIAEAVNQWSKHNKRPAALIAESNVYDPEMIRPASEGGVGFDAQWCDDFLHSVFAVVRPGEQLCHRSYETGSDLHQTMHMGFVYEGTLHRQRGRVEKGERVDTHPMIYSIQNHDFIGNHPLGKRFHQLTSLDTQKAAAALLLLSPAIPMLFMGEEFACENPFRFFVDFGDAALRDAVVEGRRREYPQHDWSSGILPVDAKAYSESKIGCATDGSAELRRWYQDLLSIRKQWIGRGLLDDQHLRVETDIEQGLYALHYDNGTSCGNVMVRLGPAVESAAAIPLDQTKLGERVRLHSDSDTNPFSLHLNQASILDNLV